MFENVHSLRKRSNEFVRNINLHKATAIETNDRELVKINQDQLQSSKLADDKDITPLYSQPYARKKGYSKPDLYVNGYMYSEMQTTVNENDDTHEIVSFAPYTKYLYRYGKIFGIAPSNFVRARKLTLTTLKGLWNSLVVKA